MIKEIDNRHSKHFHDSQSQESTNPYSYKQVERKRLLITIIITTVVMFIEIAGGIFSKSLALLSDAGHMLTHSFALFVSFIAILYAARKPPVDKSFGFYRVEILAALFNGITLIIISGFILWRAILRIINPHEIDIVEMLIVSLIGLTANLVSAFILHGSSKNSLNIKSAFLHMIGDTASSVAIIIGGIVIYYTNFYLLDPILSVLICIAILYWAFILIRDSMQILMETTPKGVDVKKLETELIKEIDAVKSVHDIHIWQITDNMYYMTAHVVIDDMNIHETSSVLNDINNFLAEKYHIGHLVIQFETHDCPPHKYNLV